MKVGSITRRIMVQMVNDKRTLALIVLAPIFLITLIYLLLGDSNYTPKLIEYNVATPIMEQISKEELNITTAGSLEEGKQKIADRKADAFLYQSDSGMTLLFESNDSALTGKVVKSIRNAMTSVTSASGAKTDLTTEYVYGASDSSMFDSMGYIMLAILSFFIIFILAGISFLRERTNQTMERLLLTPVKRWQVILGYTLGFGFFAFVQSIILLFYVIYVLKMPLAGSALSMGVILILLALSAVCIGAFFSIFTNNEFQMVQFIPIIVIPQIFFSGLISLDMIPFHLGYLSKIMPVYYACDALKSICIRGNSLFDVRGDVLALLIFIGLFFLLNTNLLKKYRSI